MEEDIGLRIKDVRVYHRIKQFEIAKAYKAKASYISDLELGKIDISQKTFERFIEAFKNFNIDLEAELKKAGN